MAKLLSFGLSLAVLCTVVAIIIGLATTPEEDAEHVITPLMVVSHRDGDPVLIDAFVSDDRPTTNEHVYCWFRVRTSHGTIENVELRNWYAPGFGKLTFPQRRAERASSDKPFTFVSTGGVATTPLNFAMTAEFSWLASGATHQRVVALGPIIVETRQSRRLRKVSAAYLGYMKDLALPLMVAWFTLVGTQALKRAEWERTAREAVLERVRNSSGNLRLAAKAMNIARRFDTIRAKPLGQSTEDDFDIAAYMVLQLFSAIRELMNANGGYILPGKDGEEIVAFSQDLFYRLVNREIIDMESRTRAVKHVSPTMDFADFKDDALLRSSVKQFRLCLKAWLSSGDPQIHRAIVLMRIMAEVLMYEINVAYISTHHMEWLPRIEENDLHILESFGDAESATLSRTIRAYLHRHRKGWR